MNQNLKLTQRERDVVSLLSQGLTNQQIADTLFISISTVISHVHNVMRRGEFGGSRVKLAVWFVKTQ